jgi:AcrR family transcriptional regulator
MQKLSYKEREKRRRAEEILTTAERLLTERGYANLNMDELADVVGISKPTLYQHFKSKEELVAQVVLRGFDETEQFLAKPLDESAIERLKGLLRWWITKRYAAGNMMSGMRPDALWNAMRANPDLETRKARMHAHLSSLIDTAKGEGDIDPDLPTPIVVHSLVCLQWAMRDASFQEELAQQSDGLEHLIDSLTRVFLYGVTPRTETMS